MMEGTTGIGIQNLFNLELPIELNTELSIEIMQKMLAYQLS